MKAKKNKYIKFLFAVYKWSVYQLGFLGGSVVRNPLASVGGAGDAGLISGSGRSPGEGKGNPFYHSCLKNPVERGARRATVQRVTKSQIRLSD